jgi:hypothetical protein
VRTAQLEPDAEALKRAVLRGEQRIAVQKQHGMRSAQLIAGRSSRKTNASALSAATVLLAVSRYECASI